MFCEKCGHQLEEGSNFCEACGNVVSSENTALPMPAMKWYKFLIYFALFAGAVGSLWSGIQYVTGLIYGENIIVYDFVDGLKTLDVVMGGCLIARAVLFIVTRSQLAKFKKNGPKLVVACYATDIIWSVVYIVGLVSVYSGILDVSEFLDISELVGPVCVDIIMIVYNISYFKQREYLFVN